MAAPAFSEFEPALKSLWDTPEPHQPLMLAMRSLRIDVVREFCRPFLEAAKQPAPRAEQAIDNIVALMFKCEVR